jgi:hypothetical protein
MSRMGASTITESATTSSAVYLLPDNCVTILLRASSVNTDLIYCKIDDYTANTGDMILRAGEFFSLDIATALKLKMSMGYAIQLEDFLKTISFKSASGTQTLEIDAFGLQIPIIK